MALKKTDNKRSIIAFVFVIILGYAIGILIKKVHIGLLIGLGLGLIGSMLWRRR